MRDDNRGHYRSIYCAIWDDPEFQRFSPSAQLVFFNLRTCREANFPCIFPMYRSSLRERMPNMKAADIEKGWSELEDAAWIQYERPILWIVKGLRNEPNYVPHNRKHRAGIENLLKSLPKLDIVKKFMRYYGFDAPLDTPSDTPTDKGIADQSNQGEGGGEVKKEGRGNHNSPADLQGAWNQICKSLPKCTVLTDKRKKKAKARLSEHVLEQYEYIFRKIEASAFCRGENNRGWRADFDWITANAENPLKVLEGKYDGASRGPVEKQDSCYQDGCESKPLITTGYVVHCRKHDPILST